MGTTLTGTEIKDTYDSLIKISDNSTLSGTAKYLSDGLGNDSVLALSTSQAQLNGNLLFNSGYAIGTNTSDGSDNQGTYLCGGANQTVGRGANIRVHGNEFSGNEGDIVMYSGNVANSEIQLRAYTSSSLISFYTNETEKMRITSAGNVGIGTSTINNKLAIAAIPYAVSQSGGIRLQTSGGEHFGDINIITSASGDPRLGINPPAFGGTTEAFSILYNGNVGIGTTSPQQKLHIASVSDNSYGLITTATNWASNLYTGIKLGSTGDTYGAGADLRSYSYYSANAKTELALWVNNTSNTMVEVVRATENGLTFNGDTAAANALDDYEEGTFTPSLTFNAQSVGMTYSVQSGKYVKVGSKVSVTCYVVLSNKGTSTGAARVAGLPFTIPSNNGNYGAISFFSDGNISYTGTMQGFGNINSTTIVLAQVIEAGTTSSLTDANFANNSAFMISFTYFVS